MLFAGNLPIHFISGFGVRLRIFAEPSKGAGVMVTVAGVADP